MLRVITRLIIQCVTNDFNRVVDVLFREKFDVFRVHELTLGHGMSAIMSAVFERQVFVVILFRIEINFGMDTLFIY